MLMVTADVYVALLSMRQGSNAFTCTVWIYISLTSLYCCLCFRDEETEAQRD